MMNITNHRTVLCVDDDLDDRELVCSVINDIDPSIIVVNAENGSIACELLSKAKETKEFPCLIILDINMPIMNGKETLIEIKKDKDLSNIPVAMFTTSSNPAEKKYFSQYGVDVVTKPNDMDNIIDEVRKLLTYCTIR